MIALLRRRHRLLFVLLAVALPIVLALALAARRSPPVQDLPAGLEAGAPPASD